MDSTREHDLERRVAALETARSGDIVINTGVLAGIDDGTTVSAFGEVQPGIYGIRVDDIAYTVINLSGGPVQFMMRRTTWFGGPFDVGQPQVETVTVNEAVHPMTGTGLFRKFGSAATGYLSVETAVYTEVVE